MILYAKKIMQQKRIFSRKRQMSHKVPGKSVRSNFFFLVDWLVDFILTSSDFWNFQNLFKVQVLYILAYMMDIFIAFQNFSVYPPVWQVILSCSLWGFFCGFFFCMLSLWKKVRNKIYFFLNLQHHPSFKLIYILFFVNSR